MSCRFINPSGNHTCNGLPILGEQSGLVASMRTLNDSMKAALGFCDRHRIFSHENTLEVERCPVNIHVDRSSRREARTNPLPLTLLERGKRDVRRRHGRFNGL